MDTPARILLVDIETSPSLGFVWGKWQQDVIEFQRDWYLLSFAYKWLGEKTVQVRALPDYSGFKKDMENDKALAGDLWELFDQADIIIGHNLEKFDIKKSNTRFLTHGLPPPSPYRTVDTLKLARKIFRFDSNKLDELGKYLGIGRKIPHTGFRLWRLCMVGDAASWKIMRRYNKHDVELLEKVYYIMRAWHPTHPNIAQQEVTEACPTCASIKVQRRGFSYTMLRKKQRVQCLTCRHWYYLGACKI